MQLRYRILNVFTVNGARLSGNPLCVFEDGSQLDATVMQTLARQMNLSESTFILPSKRAAAGQELAVLPICHVDLPRRHEEEFTL